MARSLAGSRDLLVLVGMMLSMCILVFSTLEYFLERGELDPKLGYYVREEETQTDEDGNLVPSPFDSIPSAFWWCIVTLMTVGYGDVFPISVGGKVVAGVTMVFGIFSLSLPTSIIGSNFTQEWLDYKAKEKESANLHASPEVNHLEKVLGTTQARWFALLLGSCVRRLLWCCHEQL